MSSLTEELTAHVRACFSGLWIETLEPAEALIEISQLCRERQWQLARWNLETGLDVAGETAAESVGDPLSAVRWAERLATPEGAGLLVLENFHRFLGSAEIVQALARQIELGKRLRTCVVVLAPQTALPIELQKLFVTLVHPLPDRGQLEQVLRELAAEEEIPAGARLVELLDAAAGLSRYEAEGAFSLSLIRQGTLEPETIWRLKAQQLRQSKLLSLAEGTCRFADLGGLEALKAFCTEALARRTGESEAGPPVRARGVLLLSPPGCGKSAWCQALGREVGRPTLRLDVGALLGSLVGETERNVRAALAIAEAMAPCLLFIDEIDKALAGVGGQGDSGVAARLFGTLLTWLADRTSDVFVVATANDVARLPPELARAERFDGLFFIDLPAREAKDAIWEIHRRRYAIAADDRRPDDDQWTGAEIAACCRLAALLRRPLAAAAELVVPVALSAAESLAALRRWADGRCLAADQGGVYRASQARRRRRSVDPSVN
jgi:hypothetical protein